MNSNLTLETNKLFVESKPYEFILDKNIDINLKKRKVPLVVNLKWRNSKNTTHNANSSRTDEESCDSGNRFTSSAAMYTSQSRGDPSNYTAIQPVLANFDEHVY